MLISYQIFLRFNNENKNQTHPDHWLNISKVDISYDVCHVKNKLGETDYGITCLIHDVLSGRVALANPEKLQGWPGFVKES